MSWGPLLPRDFFTPDEVLSYHTFKFPHPYKFTKYEEFWHIKYDPKKGEVYTHAFQLQTLPNNCGVALLHGVHGYDKEAFDWIENFCKASTYNYIMIGHTEKAIIEPLIDRGYNRILDFTSRRTDNDCTLLIKELE